MAEKKKKAAPKRTRKKSEAKPKASAKGRPKKKAAAEAVPETPKGAEIAAPSVEVITPSLKEEIFGVKTRPRLLQQAVVMQMNNRRAGTASTKTRGLVRGGGKKPWRQKGTGRARAGSSRSPLWVGGGTIFGPQPRDYSYRMPRSARRAALRSALSLKNQEGKIIVLKNIELSQVKTKLMVQLLEGLKVKNALVVIPGADERVELSARNLPTVKVLRAEGLNVYDLLRYEHLILTEGALRLLEERLAA